MFLIAIALNIACRGLDRPFRLMVSIQNRLVGIALAGAMPPGRFSLLLTVWTEIRFGHPREMMVQVLDEQKRLKILSVAAKLFATQPFHKVLLSDVAEAACVGKGTVYTYFKSKDDLYLSVLHYGFASLLARLRTWIGEARRSPVEKLSAVIREMVGFSYQNPHHFTLMRTVSESRAEDRISKWKGNRRELIHLIESVLREGIDRGLFDDPHPELTARFIPGCVRSLMIDATDIVDAATASDHISRFVMAGIQKRGNEH